MSRLVTTRSDIRMWPRLSLLNANTGHIIASYCLQSLIGLANLQPYPITNFICISKGQQENMKFTIINHLAAFFVSYYMDNIINYYLETTS